MSKQLNLSIEYKKLKLGPSVGKGACGEVFKGTVDENQVAIRVYHFRDQFSRQRQAKILHEVDIMAGLNSDFLVTFYGICLDQHCLVMEFCEGGSLRARLDKTDQAISFPDRLRWAKQISYGLRDLHRARIIHRDLRGENILFDKDGNAKLGDFGLSIIKIASTGQADPNDSKVANGLRWLAPEIFSEKPKYTFAADVYSLGMVLWEMMSRQRPHRGINNFRTLSFLVFSGKREKIDSDWASIFKTYIQACWHADPSERPTAEQVGNAFDKALTSIEAGPKPIGKSPEELEIKKLKQAKSEKQRLREEKSAPVNSSVQSFPRFMPVLKAALRAVELQDELVTACENGDIKTVQAALKKGAKPDKINTTGKQPLGAAVYGMNPEVVQTLLEQMSGVSPMTWEECETHNKKHYKDEIFIVPKFAPQTFKQWYALLQKMEPNPFICAYHLSKAAEMWDYDTSSWDKLKNFVKTEGDDGVALMLLDWRARKMGKRLAEWTETGFLSFRSQIQQGIETAAKLKVGKTF